MEDEEAKERREWMDRDMLQWVKKEKQGENNPNRRETMKKKNKILTNTMNNL